MMARRAEHGSSLHAVHINAHFEVDGWQLVVLNETCKGELKQEGHACAMDPASFPWHVCRHAQRLTRMPLWSMQPRQSSSWLVAAGMENLVVPFTQKMTDCWHHSLLHHTLLSMCEPLGMSVGPSRGQPRWKSS